MDPKQKKLLTLGGLAVGGYLLYRATKKPVSLGLGYMPLGSVTSDAQDAKDKLNQLYVSYTQSFASIPVEMWDINPSKMKNFTDNTEMIRQQISSGDVDFNNGDVDKALAKYNTGLRSLENYLLTEIKNFLTSAPKAVADYKAKMATATTAAQQAEAQKSASKLSLSAQRQMLIEQRVELVKKNESLEEIDKKLASVEAALRAAGAPLGITGGKGFFGNMSDMISRFKWYAIGAAGVYVAIKFGPSILSWVQSGRERPASAPPSSPAPAAVAASNPRRRRRARR